MHRIEKNIHYIHCSRNKNIFVMISDFLYL